MPHHATQMFLFETSAGPVLWALRGDGRRSNGPAGSATVALAAPRQESKLDRLTGGMRAGVVRDAAGVSAEVGR